MQIISFMNMKGGVGKTTVAVNVAYGLAALHDKQVLLVDCDPQFNASQYLLKDERYLDHIDNPNKGTVLDVFKPTGHGSLRTLSGGGRPISGEKADLKNCTLRIYDGTRPGKARAGKGRLDLIPSILDLVEIQSSGRQTENRLKLYLAEKAANYDYVIIDCPPTISIFTQAAIIASHKYVVPIKPDPLSVLGLPLLERYIDDFTSLAGMKLEQVGIIFTLVRRPISNTMKGVMADLRTGRKGQVFDAVSTVADAVSTSVEKHVPIYYFDKASTEVKAQFMDITAEFLRRTGPRNGTR